MRWAWALVFISISSTAAGQETMNTLTPEERAQGWRLLFDGKTTAGWRGWRQDTVPPGWQVVDGALTRVGPGGDIITRDQFRNFELVLEWKVAPGGNSGIFYRASEDDSAIYWTAPEMQVLDDAAHADGQDRLTSAGALYGLYPAPRGAVKPAGEWNQVRIVVNGNHVEHWLNGVKLVECDLGSPDWEARVKASKFAPHPRFGKNAEGYIGLQDHGDWVAYRNIKIRELP
ncbi:MAG TPA: DUF1080 domain-containing protein [Gemmatimonadales bacterium]|nr:DUF1080 domain-containing protein [Gemmatimonadales bacterium]